MNNVSGSSDQVREVAYELYVKPALHSGQLEFAIPVRPLLDELESKGFPRANVPQVCSAVQTSKFLRQHGLELQSVEGPPSKMSTTVVFHYRVASRPLSSVARPLVGAEAAAKMEEGGETSSERAARHAQKLKGLLKYELAQYGGGEAFLKWVRSDEDVK